MRAFHRGLILIVAAMAVGSGPLMSTKAAHGAAHPAAAEWAEAPAGPARRPAGRMLTLGTKTATAKALLTVALATESLLPVSLPAMALMVHEALFAVTLLAMALTVHEALFAVALAMALTAHRTLLAVRMGPATAFTLRPKRLPRAAALALLTEKATEHLLRAGTARAALGLWGKAAAHLAVGGPFVGLAASLGEL
jgi:hypothetical protein